MPDVLSTVRAHVLDHFTAAGAADPDEASVTFLGTDRMVILRFADPGGEVAHYVSIGCSAHPMGDPAVLMADPLHGPRAEVTVSLRGPAPTGLARSLAVLAATPAVEGLVLEADALIDLETPLWQGAPFTAFLLGRSDIGDVDLPEPASAVTVLAAVPITATEAAWVRLKGAEAMRDAWTQDGVDVTDPRRRAASPA